MATESESPATVEVAASVRRSRALWLVYADSDHEHRAGQVAAALTSAQQGTLSLDGLLEARRDGRLVGAAWGQVMPGRTGMTWGAQLTAGEPESTALRLHAALDAHFDEHDVRVAQASLHDAPTPTEARLRASGYRHAADVRYLACLLNDALALGGAADRRNAESDDAEGDLAARDDQAAALDYETYSEARHARLAALVERTYQQTLDCPALNGVREIDDVLAGYRHTGSFAAERWLIARQGQRDVGCLLLADHPLQNQWELVYMGIVPEARGMRLGLAVTRHAQRLAHGAGRERLVLAVDAANAPALELYRRAGFLAWDQRRVFLKIFRRDSKA